MRRLDKRSITTFYIFGAVVFSIIGLIVFMVAKNVQSSQAPCYIAADSLLYDDNNRYLRLEDEGIITKKWDGNYYLKYAGSSEYCLGAKAVVFESVTGSVRAFGGGYQIMEDAGVAELPGRTRPYHPSI